MQDQENQSNSEVQRVIQEGEEAKTTVLQYIDRLITTCNDSMPDDHWCVPVPHPCAVPSCDINDVDEDYCKLVNTVQRHTHCSRVYCLRRKAGQYETMCRFEYPQTSSTIAFERLENGTVRATLTSKQNDPRVNSHNRVMLQHWRANVDLQVIVDVQACARSWLNMQQKVNQGLILFNLSTSHVLTTFTIQVYQKGFTQCNCSFCW